MKPDTRAQVDALARMSLVQLQQRHRELLGQEPTSTHCRFLFRKLSWRLQVAQEGGLSETARELARAIAREAPLRTRVIANAEKRRTGFPLEQTKVTTLAPTHDSRLPMPGSLIVKQFREQTLVVKVLDDGFEYDGRRYPSLSAIARQITGTKWNGFLFFALTKEKINGRH